MSKGAHIFRLTLGLMAIVACGCDDSSPSKSAKRGALQPSDHPPPPLPIAHSPGFSVNTDDAIIPDASSARLDDIVGALLFYIRANQGVPPTLDDLKTLPGVPENLNTISPSGQPYMYAPQGLTAPNSNKRLLVYDPEESANGRRWCILVSQVRPGAPLTAEVLALPEISFRAYLASGE